MRVRRATPSDLEKILALEQSLATAPHWTREIYHAILSNEASSRCCFVAEIDSPDFVFAGFAIGAQVAGEGELETVAVHQRFQQQGLGRALCEAVIRCLTGAGAQAITLEVRAHSERARRLYLGLGFRETGRRSGYYDHPEDDAVVMRLQVKPDHPVSRSARTGTVY